MGLKWRVHWRSIVCVLVSLFFSFESIAQQRIKNFQLSNYGKEHRKRWKLVGEEALIFDNHIEIKRIKANVFSPNSQVEIKAKTAFLDRKNMNVLLKNDVEVEDKKGMRLVTNSLNWENEDNLVSTRDWVQVKRNSSLEIKAQGFAANLHKDSAHFDKEVKVTLKNSEKDKEVTIITCDGPLEIDYGKRIAIFKNNVVVTHPQGKMFSPKVVVYFSKDKKEKIEKIVSEGGVKIVRGDNVAWAEKVTYLDSEKRIILEGNPRLVVYPLKQGELKQDNVQ